MSGIDKVISYRMIYPLQHISLLIMAILLLLLCSVETKAESYYIINPNSTIENSTKYIYQTPNMSEWLMLSPVAGSSTKFEILLPAYFPGQFLVNTSTTVNNDLVNCFIENKIGDGGFKFVIASKSQIEEIAYKRLLDNSASDNDAIYAIKSGFLCPKINDKSNQNYLVYDKNNSVKGSLAKYNPHNGHQWEIGLPKKERYLDSDFKINSYFGGKKPNSTESDWCIVNYMQYIGNDALDGAYKLVIDVENNTWEMTYDANTRVGYLAMIPAAGDNIDPNIKQVQASKNNSWTYSDYQSYATYTFTQSKNKDGNFDNIYYNPAVYLEGGKKRLIYFSNSQANWNSDYAISNSVEKNKYNDLDNAMIDAIDVRDPIHFLYSGPSGSGVTFNYPSENSLVSFWGHKMNKDTPLGENPLSIDGCYYKLKWYPYVTGPGVVKIGDGNNSEDDKPKFSKVFLKSTKDVSAYSDGYKYVAVKNDIELTHDWDRDLYYVTLSKDNFLFKYDKSGKVNVSYNGQLYFQGADANGNFLTDYTWMDDGTDKNTPTEGDPDYLYQTDENGFKANIDNTDKQHLSKYMSNNKAASTYTIYFKLVENGVEKPHYWVELDKPIQIPITYNCGYYVRTFSDDVAYDLPSDVYAYQVNSFNVFDSNTYDEYRNKTYTATTGLSKMDYIPKNTGVVLRDKNAEKDNDKDGRNLIHYITLTPGSTKDTKYADNLLVPTVKRTIIGPSVFNANGKRTARNYLFGRRSYTDGCEFYIPNNNNVDYLGFFRAKDKSVSGYNKAYLQVPATGDWDKYVQLANETDIITNTDGTTVVSAKGIMLSFDDADDSVTGISEVTSEVNNNDESYYTLTGIKVTNPSGGIYIHNGKKIYIK